MEKRQNNETPYSSHRYSHEVAGVGIAAQKYNPEVRIEHPDNSVHTATDTLRAVKREIMARITWLPVSENQMRTHAGGSSTPDRRYPDGGSGSYYDQDDEDSDYDGSGYGSGDGPVDVDEEVSRNSGSPNHLQPISGSEVAGGSSAPECSTVLTVMTCVLWMATSLFSRAQ
ncbi:Glypican [Trinorchestia longiramus]|nr:Glypican [Trinorchestia longiramus]